VSARPLRSASPAAALLAAAALGALLIAAPPARAERPTELLFGHESVANPDAPLGFLTNSAAAGLARVSELGFAYTDRDTGDDAYTLVASVRGLGFAYAKDDDEFHRWILTAAGGSKRARTGTTLTWLSPDGGSRVLDYGFGLLLVPSPGFALGGTVAHAFEPELQGVRLDQEWNVGVALRPLTMSRSRAATMASRLTLTADMIWHDRGDLDVATLRFGGEAEVFDNVLVRGSIENHRGWQIGFALRGPKASAHGRWAYDSDGDRFERTWAATFEEPGRGGAMPPPRRRLAQ
jgi:hypothetical protein